MSDKMIISWADVARACEILGLDPERLNHTKLIEIRAGAQPVVWARRHRAGEPFGLEETIEVAIAKCDCPDVDVSTMIEGPGTSTIKGYSARCRVHGKGGTEPIYREG